MVIGTVTVYALLLVIPVAYFPQINFLVLSHFSIEADIYLDIHHECQCGIEQSPPRDQIFLSGMRIAMFLTEVYVFDL